MSDLVQKVEAEIARQMMKTVPYDPGDRMYLSVARAAVNLVLDEAAKVCSYQNEYDDAVSAHAELMTCARIAAAIRAMKETE